MHITIKQIDIAGAIVLAASVGTLLINFLKAL